MAARAGSLPYLKILERCMSKIGQKDRYGNTALHHTYNSLSCTRDHLRCLEYLLASGVQVDAEDITGKTPLRVCIVLSNIEIAFLLLDGGPNIDTYTNDGMTMFLAEIFYNHRELLQLLVNRGTFGHIGVISAAAILKAFAQSDVESRNILRKFSDPAIYRSLLVHFQTRY